MYLTRKQLRVLRDLMQQSQAAKLDYIEAENVAGRTGIDTEKVQVLLSELHEAGLVEGHGNIGDVGIVLARITHSGRQQVHANSIRGRVMRNGAAVSAAITAAAATTIMRDLTAADSRIAGASGALVGIVAGVLTVIVDRGAFSGDAG